MQGQVVWFTGLSGAGKTTLCRSVAEALRNRHQDVEILDGDVIRAELWKDLGFSSEDRMEHNRRLSYLAGLLSNHGIAVLVAAISPLRSMRAIPRAAIPNFCEVFVNAPLGICEQQDPKGPYHKARSGRLKGFTGIDAPYESPLQPEVICHTDRESIEESTARVLRYLLRSDAADSSNKLT